MSDDSDSSVPSLVREVFNRMLGCFHMAEDSSSYHGAGGDEEAAEIIAETRAMVDAADVPGVPPAARVLRAVIEQTGIAAGTDGSRAVALALQIRDEQWAGHAAPKGRATVTARELLKVGQRWFSGDEPVVITSIDDEPYPVQYRWADGLLGRDSVAGFFDSFTWPTSEWLALLARLDASPIAPPAPWTCPKCHRQTSADNERCPSCGAPPGEPTAPVQTWATDLAGMPVDSVPPTAVNPEVPRCAAWCGKSVEAVPLDTSCYLDGTRAFCSLACRDSSRDRGPAQPGGPR